MPHFDVVVATKDSHPADHVSFASRHPGRTVGDVIEAEGVEQVLWPDHCAVPGPRGRGMVDALDRNGIHRIVEKGTDRGVDSYSGFFDNGRRTTGLGELLRERNVTDVYILGLATDYCVKATALDAVAERLRHAPDRGRLPRRRPHARRRRAHGSEMRQAGVRLVRSDRLR